MKAKNLSKAAMNKAKNIKVTDDLKKVTEAYDRPINWFDNAKPVNQMALMNKEYGYALETVADVLHAEYLRSGLPSGQESVAYRKGLEDFLTVFSKSEEDIY